MTKFDTLLNEYKKTYNKKQTLVKENKITEGWGLDEEPLAGTELEDLLNELDGLSYEIRNCQRGEYINTFAQLGQQLIDLGERLSSVGNEIMGFSAEYDTDEDDEEY